MAIAAAAYADPDGVDVGRAAERYERATFGRTCGLLDAYRTLARYGLSEPVRFTGDRFEPAPLEEQLAAIRADWPTVLDAARETAAWAGRAETEHREVRLAADAARELAFKARFALEYENWKTTPALVDLASLRAELDALETDHRALMQNFFTAWTLEMDARLRFGAHRDWLARQGAE